MSSTKNAAAYEALPQSDAAAAAPAKARLPSCTPRAVFATCLYCCAGPSLIFLNKHILVDIDFPRVPPSGMFAASTRVEGEL